MNRLLCVALATVFFALSAPTDSSAQATIFVGGAATIPVGSLTDVGGFVAANTGWQGTAGAQFAVGTRQIERGLSDILGRKQAAEGPGLQGVVEPCVPFALFYRLDLDFALGQGPAYVDLIDADFLEVKVRSQVLGESHQAAFGG